MARVDEAFILFEQQIAVLQERRQALITVSARFVSPKPFGPDPAERGTWPTRETLSRWKGWRVDR